MNTVFLAVFGRRPDPVTLAFDHLRTEFQYHAVGLIATESTREEMADGAALGHVIRQQYPGLPVRSHRIDYADGGLMLENDTQLVADDYYRKLLKILHQYGEEGYRRHLLISSNVNVMSIYAVLAASVVFHAPHDRVWVAIAPSAGEKAGPRGLLQGKPRPLELLNLPIITARLPRGVDPFGVLQRRADPRADFMSRLSPAERLLVERIVLYPYSTNEELARGLGKEKKTLENQLTTIYDKMIGFLDLGDFIPNKRQALLDLVRME